MRGHPDGWVWPRKTAPSWWCTTKVNDKLYCYWSQIKVIGGLITQHTNRVTDWMTEWIKDRWTDQPGDLFRRGGFFWWKKTRVQGLEFTWMVFWCTKTLYWFYRHPFQNHFQSRTSNESTNACIGSKTHWIAIDFVRLSSLTINTVEITVTN